MQNSKEIKALTGLRGAAAVFVAAYHFGPHIPDREIRWILHKAYLSVDLFFVLSGLVMAMTYHRWFARGGNWRTFGQYMWLRIARIWPLYVLAVAAKIGEQYIRGIPQPELKHDLLPNLLMIQGWGIAPSINIPLWSVSTEFVAYLLFPVLLVAIARARPWVTGLQFGACLIAIAIVTVLAPYNGERLGLLDIDGARSIYPVFRCVIGFTLGLIVWRAGQTAAGAAIASSSKWGLATAFLLLVLFAVNANDVLIYAVLPIVLLCVARDQGALAKVLGSPPVHWLGILSFAIYALQSPFYGVTEPFLARVSGLLPHGVSTIIYYGATAVGLLLVSAATHYFFERPSRLAMRAIAGQRKSPPAVSG